jgi:hypothetical protein
MPVSANSRGTVAESAEPTRMAEDGIDPNVRFPG